MIRGTFAIVFALLAAFQLGWIANEFTTTLVHNSVATQTPESVQKDPVPATLLLHESSLDSPRALEPVLEKQTPSDRVKESQIHVLQDKIVLDIPNAQWSTFTPTKSMIPVLDTGTNALQIAPEQPQDLRIGDIISYQSELLGGVVIHRIIELGSDNQGWYAVVKGDNNTSPDPEKVRFSQIKRVVVAIVY